jgi:hypothetical protein
MTAHITRLSGEDWQNWANKILAVHHGPTEYQQIPDHDRGDAGLEGYTLGNGYAYQAYGCEEPISTADRFEKQRDKMTKDIGKFIGNRPILTRIFGTVQINCADNSLGTIRSALRQQGNCRPCIKEDI